MPPQVLGLTASPASRDSLDATLQALHQLELNLDAQLYVVDESDEELRVRVGDRLAASRASFQTGTFKLAAARMHRGPI